MNVERTSIYEVVSKIKQMILAGEKISVRNVMSKARVSPAKATEAINLYNEEQKQQVDNISDDVLQALAKDKITAIEKARSEDNAQIKQQEEIISELKEIIVQHEEMQKIAEATAKNLNLAEEKIKMLEQDLATTNAQKDSSLSEVATLKQQLHTANVKNEKLDNIMSEKQTTEQKCTALQAKLEQVESQLNTLYNKFQIK